MAGEIRRLLFGDAVIRRMVRGKPHRRRKRPRGIAHKSVYVREAFTTQQRLASSKIVLRIAGTSR
jgi:hypothetical protein